jgi:hypothetical protein
MGLETVSKAVAEHLSADGAAVSKAEKERRILERMLRTMGAGGIVAFVGVVALVIGKKLIYSNQDLFELIGGLAVLAGVFIMCYGLFSAMLAGVRGGPKTTAPAKPELNRNTSPEGLPEPPASVTEQTTKILETNR